MPVIVAWLTLIAAAKELTVIGSDWTNARIVNSCGVVSPHCCKRSRECRSIALAILRSSATICSSRVACFCMGSFAIGFTIYNGPTSLCMDCAKCLVASENGLFAFCSLRSGESKEAGRLRRRYPAVEAHRADTAGRRRINGLASWRDARALRPLPATPLSIFTLRYSWLGSFAAGALLLEAGWVGWRTVCLSSRDGNVLVYFESVGMSLSWRRAGDE